MALTLENLKIGGRNLVPDTDFTRGILRIDGGHGLSEILIRDDNYSGQIPLYEGRKYIHAYAGEPGDKYYYLKPEISVEADETYTISFYSRFAGSINGNSTYFRYNTGQHIFIPLNLNSPNKWARNSYTFTTPSDVTGLSLRFGFIAYDHSWLAISSIKLEKGNVATDWTPAIEDFAMRSDIPQNVLTTDRIFVSSTQPANPKEGDIWFKR